MLLPEVQTIPISHRDLRCGVVFGSGCRPAHPIKYTLGAIFALILPSSLVNCHGVTGVAALRSAATLRARPMAFRSVPQLRVLL